MLGKYEYDTIACVEGMHTWHGQHVSVPADATTKEWARIAGFKSFLIELAPQYRFAKDVKFYPNKDGVQNFWMRRADVIENERSRQILRVNAETGEVEDDGFGTVSDEYQPVQPMDQFEFIAHFAEQGDASLRTAGTLLNGRKVFALLDLGESWEVRGHKVEGNLLVANHNDGSGAFRILVTEVDVVCYNTLSYALRKKGASEQGDFNFSINHRTKWTDAMRANVKLAMGLAREQFAERKQVSELLDAHHLEHRQALEFIAKVSGSTQAFVTKDGPGGAALVDAILDNHELAEDLIASRTVQVDPQKLNRIGSRILENMMQGTPGAAPLSSAGVNALDALAHVTYYGTHDPRISRTQSGALDSMLMGRANVMKQKAEQTLVEMVKVGAKGVTA